MRLLPSAIAIATALALTACASKPKPPPAVATNPSPIAAREAPAPPAPGVGAVRPGSQEDLAARAGDRVYFAVDRYVLEAEAQETLTRQADWLMRYPNVKVLVAGSADERGTREYNIALGGRRAEAARQFLIGRGIAGGRIQTVSYGKERPIDLGSSEAAWARNRNAHTALMDTVGRDW